MILNAHDLVDELVAAALTGRLHVDVHVAELAVAAALTDEPALHLGNRLSDRLAVGDLRLAHVGVDVELASEPVDDDVEVELAHA